MSDIDVTGLSFGANIIDAGEAQVDWIKTLVYGSSGGGKTSLISTMPDPLLVLLTEKHGALTIKRVNPKAKILFIEDSTVCTCHNGPIQKCADPEGAKKLRAQDVLYGVLDELSTKKHPFVSVALDSLTDMQQILLHDMKGGVPGAKVTLPEWGKLIDRTRHLVKRFRNLNMHVAAVCLADEAADQNNRRVYRPSLAGKKLPGDVIQYFNLCCFQRKVRDSAAAGGAVYESVFDAGDEYYTKTHPALDPIERSNARLWIEKITEYAKAHGEGDMPTASSPVSDVAQGQKEADALRDRMNEPEIKALFDKLDATESKRLATLKKYRSNAKLVEILKKKVAEAAKKEKSK